MAKIYMDNRPLEAEEGSTVLETARRYGIQLPTLCYHPSLRPSGACKLCAVEMTAKTGRSLAMLACILKVKEGLQVRTEGALVYQARLKAFQSLLQMAPQSTDIRDLARKFQVDLGPPPDGCVRCRLCIRVCKEVVGSAALQMAKRGGKNYVIPIEGRCIGCGTCGNLCPTGAIRVEDLENVRTILIRDEVIGRHPLERCEGCGKRFATPKYLALIAQRRTNDHPDVKEHHTYCPTCSKLFSNRITTISARTPNFRMPDHR